MFDLNKEEGTLWAGDVDSFKAALELEKRAIALSMNAGFNTEAGAKEDELPRLYQRKDGVGVITIRGPLINASENFYTRYLNIATYGAIREALVFASQDAEASSILLDIESGGGQVSGVNDTANLIRQVSSLKTTVTYTGGTAASAAYWLGSAASKMFADETAIVGSIGVIVAHLSFAEALKKEGIQPTVMRSGTNKALGHPFEALSDKAKAKIQGQMDTIYNVFTGAVAKHRRLPEAKRDEWANGNEFLGVEAKDNGLIDGISSYDKVFSTLQQGVDNKSPFSNPQNHKKSPLKAEMKPVLTAEQLAAIEAGTADQATLDAAAAAKKQADEAAAVQAAADATAKAAADKVAADAAALAAAATPAPEAQKSESELNAFLRSELKASQDKIVELTVAVQTAKAESADMAASFPKLCDIARNSINKMSIALGGSEASLAALTGADLVAKHDTVAADFKKTFPVGGVASTAPEVDKPKAEAPSHLHLATVAGVGIAPRK